MRDFKQKIAVITGAAKGIGKALAKQCLDLGMRVVLADLDEPALSNTMDELAEYEQNFHGVITDVSQEASVQALAKESEHRFGTPHLLFNNAGIGGYVGPIWELSEKKIRWVMDVNFMSVVHGIKAFVPAMIASSEPGHIVNTASMAGLYAFPYFSTYVVSKHSVIALSECLYYDLQRQGQNLGVSVLCPGGVNTQILEGSKHYPDVNKDQEFLLNYQPEDTRFIGNFARMVRKGLSAEAVAKLTFEAITLNKFYILTHPELKSVVQERMDGIMAEGKPGLLNLYE